MCLTGETSLLSTQIPSNKKTTNKLYDSGHLIFVMFPSNKIYELCWILRTTSICSYSHQYVVIDVVVVNCVMFSLFLVFCWFVFMHWTFYMRHEQFHVNDQWNGANFFWSEILFFCHTQICTEFIHIPHMSYTNYR